jgi:hypothetical protein
MGVSGRAVGARGETGRLVRGTRGRTRRRGQRQGRSGAPSSGEKHGARATRPTRSERILGDPGPAPIETCGHCRGRPAAERCGNLSLESGPRRSPGPPGPPLRPVRTILAPLAPGRPSRGLGRRWPRCAGAGRTAGGRARPRARVLPGATLRFPRGAAPEAPPGAPPNRRGGAPAAPAPLPPPPGPPSHACRERAPRPLG